MNINDYRVKSIVSYVEINPQNYDLEDEFLDNVAKVLEDGVDAISLDVRGCSAKKALLFGRKLRELCSIYSAFFIVRSRADIANLLKADGFCLDDEDLDLKSAKHLLGEQCVVGYSTFLKNSLEIVQNCGYNFVVFSGNPADLSIDLNYPFPLFVIQNKTDVLEKFSVFKRF